MHIKEPLLLFGKSSPCGGNRFTLSLSEWSFTICLMPYNCKYNVLSASLNKAFITTVIFITTIIFITTVIFDFKIYQFK